MVEQDVAVGQRLVGSLGNGVNGIVGVHEALDLPGFAGLEVQLQEEARRGRRGAVVVGVGVVVHVQDDLGVCHLGYAGVVLVAETGVWGQFEVTTVFALSERLASHYDAVFADVLL